MAGAQELVLAVMVVFGVATAGVLAAMLRDVIAQVAGEGTTTEAVATATRIAMVGPVVYLLGFVTVVAAVLVELPAVGGVPARSVGFAVIVLAAVPMAAGLYLAWVGE